MNNANNNSNMTKLIFTLATVNPKILTLDPLLSGMGCGNKADEFFKAEKENLGCKSERPIIDTENNVLTHSADVIYAQENGDENIEVYVVELNDIQRRRLVAHKHRYNQKNLEASYESSIFFKKYLTETEEGKLFAESLPGKSTREKVAGLLNTSDSTIKRLWLVGDSMPEEFGLITEGNSSLKEAEEKVKLMKWKKQQEEAKELEQARKKALVENEKSNNNKDHATDDIDKSPGNEINTQVPKPPKGPKPNTPISNSTTQEDEQEISKEVYFGADSIDEPKGECRTATATSYSFNKCSLDIEGMGQFSVNVTNGTAELLINGKSIDGIKYIPIANQDQTKYANVNSFVFQEPKHKGLNVQIIISNFSH